IDFRYPDSIPKNKMQIMSSKQGMNSNCKNVKQKIFSTLLPVEFRDFSSIYRYEMNRFSLSGFYSEK
ncbi:hypothetical protein, partial [Chryseobacterium sp. CH1]|uniref:hypothetical protein n=1 Tax=Chryseobacterium sp. CH1 TaxID=713551 RepID=UPI001026B027